MTQKLYYEDVQCATFTARVLARQTTPEGPAVQLDRTACYPTGGGQPHDTGALNGIAILDVWSTDAGDIWHLLAAPLDADTVTGALDWERRFDHMQQHSGQHLLSAAFLRRLEADTIGFHLGQESSTIDLELPQLGWESAFEIEDEVNRIIWENHPVTTRFVTLEELEAAQLRRPPQTEGPIRLVQIAGYDVTPCGGTHVTHTGEIGLLKITSLERYKGGMRVTFRCGRRALLDYRQGQQTLDALARMLTVGQPELPETVARLQEESKESRRALNKAQATLRDLEADQLWHETTPQAGIRYIVGHFAEHDFAGLRGIAGRLQARPRTVLLLAATEEGGVRLVCSRSDDLPDIDAAAILRAAASALGGRGGGTPALAQGGAPHVAPETITRALHAALAALGFEETATSNGGTP